MAPLKKRAVRFKKLEINTGTTSSPVWTPVRGLNKIEMPLNHTEVDTSDFDSDGHSDSLTTFLSWQIDFEGFEGFTDDTGSPVEDPGQEEIRSKALVTGSDAYAEVRMYRTDNGKGYEGRASVKWNGTGGDLKGVEPFNGSLTGAGTLSQITVTT